VRSAKFVLSDMTSPYSAIEAWAYDRFIAPAVERQRDALERELLGRVPQDARLLDVGCGGGQIALALARRRPDLRVVGLDLSAEQVARARKRGAKLADRVSFIEGSALEQPFDDASFDVVVSVASLKHWPDQQRGLSECVRVLRPDGALLVVEADRGCSHDAAKSFVALWRVPSVLRPLSLAFFRTWVAGRSVDLEQARELASLLALARADVRRLESLPALVILGTKLP